MLRRLLVLPLAILVLTAACSGDDGDADVLGVAVERSTTTEPDEAEVDVETDASSTTERPTTTAAAPTSTTTTTAPPAPSTTTTSTTQPPASTTTTTTAPPPPTTRAPAPRSVTISGDYQSPDGTGEITVELQQGKGDVVTTQAMGPTGGSFSFDGPPGTYRIQITDVAEGTSEYRTSGTVITRTPSFTLEAGRSARFECHVRTGCAGGVR